MGSTEGEKIGKEIPEYLRGYTDQGLSKASEFVSKGFGARPDKKVLGFNPYEESTIFALKNALSAPSGGTMAGNRYIEQAFMAPSGRGNPELEAVADAITRRTNQWLAPELDKISSSYALAGVPQSSAMRGALARARLTAGQDLSSKLSDLYYNAFLADEQKKQSLLPMALTYANEPTQRLNMALGIGNLERALAQSQQDVGIENYLASKKDQLDAFQALMQALAGAGGLMYTPQYAPSEFAQNFAMVNQGLGTVANLAGAGAKVKGAYDSGYDQGMRGE